MTPEVITSATALTPTVTTPPALPAANPIITPSATTPLTITTAASESVIENRDAAISIAVTVAIAAGLAVLASIATHQVSLNASSPWVVWLAVAVGGLGGLSHEFAQSGGKILFFQRKVDGFYLGSLAGMILGAVAGLLAVRGLVATPSAVTSTGQTGPIPIIFEVFLAGLALKGVAEAAGGQAVSSTSTSSGTTTTNISSLSSTPIAGVLPTNVSN
jgi:uncharacterized protein DUF4257